MKRSYSMARRAATAAATRARILEVASLLQIEKPIVDITLAEIAARAHTTVRTVLRLFGSKQSLMNEAVAKGVERGLGEPARLGDIPAIVRSLYESYEAFGDGVIRRLADERSLPALQGQAEAGRRSLWEWTEKVFAPQLHKRRGKAKEELILKLRVLMDVYVWKILRQDQALSRADAESTTRALIAAVLKGESP